MIPCRHRRGMVLIAVVGCIFFASLIFMFMVKRVRQETILTARVSVNERLYQIASAIGRFAVRKLQRDFETRDADVSEKILEAVFQGKTAGLKDLDFTSAIIDQEVVQALISQCKGKYRDLDVSVKYDVNMGPAKPFAPEIIGLETSPFERRGSIDVVVKVSHRGITKVCRISKEFLLVRLMAPPFYRFSLFARRGAELLPKSANGIQQVNEDGEVQGRPPLVLLNRLIRNKGGKDFDFNRWPSDPNIIVRDANSFVQNGWIYLGGRGQSTDLLKKAGESGESLILNVCTGAKTDFGKGQFGEYFQFHFSPDSNGWLGSQEWNSWLNTNIPGNQLSGGAGRAMVTYVDYGHYTGLKDLKFPAGGAPLFQDAIAVHKKMTGPQEVYEQGSSLHLFGTPGYCTPTLVFGKVKRRYVRTFAFYFAEAERVYPLRFLGSSTDWDNFLLIELGAWLGGQSKVTNAPQLIMDLTAKVTHQMYLTGLAGSPPLCRLYPVYRDWEPYMMGLKNIAKPNDPAAKWNTAVPANDYVKDDPKELFDQNYQFKDDKILHYNGSIQTLKPGLKYLRDKTSYFIPEGGNSGFLKLSQCKFFMDRFVEQKGGKNRVFLNQIIGFKNSIEIDIPLEVVKGGVIFSEGSIRITQPVVNPYIANPPSHPDAFGYLTFVSPRTISLELGGGGTTLPQFHGFLVCFSNSNDGQVEVTQPVHIIGGVAADKIDSLVDKGGVIEWGFEPEELWDPSTQQARDHGIRDFYGVVLGPRDAEIVGEE